MRTTARSRASLGLKQPERAAKRPSTTIQRHRITRTDAAAGRNGGAVDGRQCSPHADYQRHLREIEPCCSRPASFQRIADKAILPLAATMVDALARLRRPPSAEHLIARAQQRTGLSDFGDIPFERPLRMLLSACGEEADLSLFGGAALRWDTVRFVSNLLRLREEEKRAPEILDQPVERPLVVAGLPRSGTTFLHILLAEDRANLVPRVWQLIHPYPAKPARRRSRSAAAAGCPAAAPVSAAGAAIPPPASDRGGFAAGMFGDHGASVRQLALRHHLPHSRLSALA